MDIPLILGDIRPDAKWGMMGEDKGDYDNIDWRDDVMTKPTLKEITDAWPATQKKWFTDVADADTRHDADLSGLLATLDGGGALDASAKKQLADVLRRLTGESK